MRNERGPGGGRQVLVTDLGPWRHSFFSVKFGCHLGNNKVVGFVYIIINMYTNYGPLSLVIVSAKRQTSGSIPAAGQLHAQSAVATEASGIASGQRVVLSMHNCEQVRKT
jgi:hypothetical protein